MGKIFVFIVVMFLILEYIFKCFRWFYSVVRNFNVFFIFIFIFMFVFVIILEWVGLN